MFFCQCVAGVKAIAGNRRLWGEYTRSAMDNDSRAIAMSFDAAKDGLGRWNAGRRWVDRVWVHAS